MMANPPQTSTLSEARSQTARSRIVPAMRKEALIALVAVLGALAVPASAATEKTVAKKSATGDFAITQVSATVKNPKRIRVRVVTSPSQKASLTWLILCSKGFSASTKDGQTDVRAPYTKTLSHPMLAKASSCTVSANSQLGDSGKVTLSILATKR